MNPSDPAIREALAVHEALRRLRFSADDIFVVPPIGEQHRLFVVLMSQGKRFTYDAGPCRLGKAFLDTWRDAVSWWNTDGHDDERKLLWEESVVRRNSVAFLVKLLDFGFQLQRDDSMKRLLN